MKFNSYLRPGRGFTLIEALVALFIVSMALFAMYTKVALAAKMVIRTEQTTMARWVAMNAVTELRLKPGLPGQGGSDGDEEMGGHQWRWDMEITDTPVEGLRRVDIDVSLADKPDRSIYSMSAFVGTRKQNQQLRPWEGIPDANDEAEPGAPGAPVAPPRPPRGNPRDSGLEPIG